MPHVELQLNYPLSKSQKKELVLKLSKAAADIIGKPMSAFSVVVQDDQDLAFAGSFDPAFNLRITCLNTAGGASNGKFVKGFTEFLEKETEVKGNRGYVFIFDPTGDGCGFEGALKWKK